MCIEMLLHTSVKPLSVPVSVPADRVPDDSLQMS